MVIFFRCWMVYLSYLSVLSVREYLHLTIFVIWLLMLKLLKRNSFEVKSFQRRVVLKHNLFMVLFVGTVNLRFLPNLLHGYVTKYQFFIGLQFVCFFHSSNMLRINELLVNKHFLRTQKTTLKLFVNSVRWFCFLCFIN